MTLAINTRVLINRGGDLIPGTIVRLPTSIDDNAIDVDLDRPDRSGARAVWVRAGSPNIRTLICGCTRDGAQICDEHRLPAAAE